MKWPGTLNVLSETATKRMGSFIRSENSLNQHIKLKHRELWEKLKSVENQQANLAAESTDQKVTTDGQVKNNEIQF